MRRSETNWGRNDSQRPGRSPGVFPHDNARNDGRIRIGSGERISYHWPKVCKTLDRFTYFWRADSPFSQHHPANFTLDGKRFNCSEQYYMCMKAVTFRDKSIETKIMATGDPSKQKSLAKQIPNFEQGIWDEISYDIVKRANIAKFGQNQKLLNLLVATRGTVLVEASPKDKTWGIGMEADHSDALRRNTWRGNNKLGQILTEIRDDEFKNFKYEPEKVAHKIFYGYHIFWRSSSPFAPKHLAPFTDGKQSYVSLFHYMMFKSADLCGKSYIAFQISEEMKQNKIESLAYGEEINVQAWKCHVNNILIEGNYYKFNDNANLKALLLGTNGKVLVYKSKFEDIGNGQEEDDNSELDISVAWNAKNSLGLLLTFMRDQWIQNPDITLKKFLDMDIFSSFQYNFKEIDKMHMGGQKPPELQIHPDKASMLLSNQNDSQETQLKGIIKRDGVSPRKVGNQDFPIQPPQDNKSIPCPEENQLKPCVSRIDKEDKQKKQDSLDKQLSNKRSKPSPDIETKIQVKVEENNSKKNVDNRSENKALTSSEPAGKKVNKNIVVAHLGKDTSSDEEGVKLEEQKSSYSRKKREKKSRQKERLMIGEKKRK